MPSTFCSLHDQLDGATPYPCDFHVHAPPDFGDSSHGKRDEDYLAEDYLPAIWASGRHVIGVPQHRAIGASGGAGLARDTARRLLMSGRRDIPVIFPGYEITAVNQIQLILLAGPDDMNVRELDQGLAVLIGLGQRSAWHESDKPLKDILEAIRERYRDRLLTLVVATGHKGILENDTVANRNRSDLKTAAMIADGFLLAKPLASERSFVQRVFQGKEPDYSKQPLPYLVGSDARSSPMLSPSNLVHVKLGSPTVEGLRQALLNHLSFVSGGQFGVPPNRLHTLSVKNTVFLDDVTLRFNPNLNVLVGGRGTGKSCLLEYIAHVCDFPRSSSYDRPNSRILTERSSATNEGTLLPSTQLTLCASVGAKFYRVDRASSGSPTIQECEDGNFRDGVPLPSQSPSMLLNLRFFGQRELANIVRNEAFFTLDPAQAAGTNLFSFLKSDQLTAIGELERAAREKADAIEKISIDMSSWGKDLEERPRITAELNRLRQDLKRIRDQADKQAFHEHSRYQSVEAAYQQFFRLLDDVGARLREGQAATQEDRSRLSALPFPAGPGEEDFRTLREAATTQADQLLRSLNELHTQWQAAAAGLRASTPSKLLSEMLQRHAADYEAAKKEVADQNLNLALLEPLQRRIHEIETRLESFAQIERQLLNARVRRRQLVEELRQIRARQGNVYDELARGLTESTSERVRMSVQRAGDVMTAVLRFQEGLRDKRKFRTNDAEQLARLVEQEARTRGPTAHPATIWSELVDDVLDSFEAKQDVKLGISSTAASPRIVRWGDGVVSKLRDIACTSFEDRLLSNLLCLYVPDKIEMQLQRQHGSTDYIPIEHASVGQKATALFLILLAQTDGLLVVDQPEDDLDNAFIAHDILPVLRDLKHRQQIIFATHNANMLVNAEAEKVVALSTEPRPTPQPDLPAIHGIIFGEGALDESKLREHVANTLEGGREAFLARERKYRYDPQ